METKLNWGNPYITTAIYYLSFIGLGMGFAVLGPTLQGLSKNTGSTLAQISSLFLISSFGYLLGSIAAGRMYDRVKGHPVLSLMLLVMAALMAFVPLMKTLLILQILFFIIGIAEGSLDVGANTLIVWLHGDRVPPFMNGLHASFGIGTTIAPLIVAAVLGSSGSLNTIYWALTIIILPAGLLINFFPSPSHILASKQAEERPAVPILVFLAAVIIFAYVGAELGFGGWIYTYSTNQVHANPTTAASINAAFWAAFTVGRLISIPLAAKIKPKVILWMDLCGVILSLFIILLFPKVEGLLWLGTIGTGLFMAPIFPTVMNDAQSRMHITGKITSLFFVGTSLGSMTLPWLMGQLIAPFGPTAAIIAVLCSILLATGTFFILNMTQRTTRTPLPQLSRSGKSEG